MKYLVAIPIICLLCFFALCSHHIPDYTSENIMEKDSTEKHTNRLINESSPYLLQHADNPVDWYPWGEEALNKAKEEDKILLISIGYSACHWCHVMEHESFENKEVAKFMNENFVNIKVDREERPDVDQVYMDAVQTITGSGGWPLNCFALPNGRPFFGGTYFTKKNWMYLLKNITTEYQTNRKQIENYADSLTRDINRLGLAKPDIYTKDMKVVVQQSLETWFSLVDTIYGGPSRAPKFPLPNNYEYLMHHAHILNDFNLMDYVELTLDKMISGGIYDQLGGGFARYSTDLKWKVPHFEKMLYDNAQLVSLYSKAFSRFGKTRYKEVVYQTLEFIEREMTGENGEFHAALDADSEGEEGKFYVWTDDELQSINGLDYPFVKALYSINRSEMWENQTYILQRQKSHRDLMKEFSLSDEEIGKKIEVSRELLFKERGKRVRPGLDNKSLTSWNALMLSGYVDAYRVFNEEDMLKKALNSARFIEKQQTKKDGTLYHNYKDGSSHVSGFLEDYAFVIAAYIDLYEVTFDIKWIDKASALLQICNDEFYSEENDLYYFTSSKQSDLVARKFEVADNVIPASNSVMAHNLYKLGHYLSKPNYIERTKQMIAIVQPSVPIVGASFSNWMILMDHQLFPFYEIAICGENAVEKSLELQGKYLPNSIVLGTEKKENLPLLENKLVKGKTMIYVCVDKTCKLPVEDIPEAKKQIVW